MKPHQALFTVKTTTTQKPMQDKELYVTSGIYLAVIVILIIVMKWNTKKK